ncbi:MAG: PEP-CTERM sorting domain-containing protein [Desulfobacteraceae bacterium]|nr:PEP-CTERM sorting domain-containing protein [Desulfobacteraceae bacterium]
MGKISKMFFAILLITGMAVPSAATLLRDGDVVYDDINSRYWFAALDELTSKTMDQQISFIGNLTENYGATVLDDWKLAEGAMGSLWNTYSASQIAAAFDHTFSKTYSEFSKVGNKYWTKTQWYGRYEDLGWINVNPDKGGGDYYTNAWYIEQISDPYSLNSYNRRISTDAYSSVGAWATTTGPAILAPVPTPATMVLFGSGMIGLVGIMWRKSKKHIL